MTGTLGAALSYARRGWRIVPISSGQKRPATPGWQNLVVKPKDMPRLFGDSENVGVILGPASGYLVDVDLDCPEAVELADLYLPGTGAVFGRPAKPRSHRLFVALGAVYESFADTISSGMLLELRGPGRDGGAHLTLLPPSFTSGEQREWHGDVIAPRVIDACSLRTSVAWLAIACLVARHISRQAAERPSRALPRLLWGWDYELGRAAYRWLGQPAPDAPRSHPRPRSQLSRRDLDLAEIVNAIANNCDWHGWNRSEWRSSPHRADPKKASYPSTTTQQNQPSINLTPSRSGGATTATRLPAGSAWARSFTWRGSAGGRLGHTPKAGYDRLSSRRSGLFPRDQACRRRIRRQPSRKTKRPCSPLERAAGN
jgi:hypothetical protein